MILALLLLFGTSQVSLMDEVVVAPRGEWRSLPIHLKQDPAVIESAFKLLDGKAGVRVALLRTEDADRLREGQNHEVLAATPFSSEGVLRFAVRDPGEYELIVDNTSGSAASALIHLRVALDFGAQPELEVRYPSPERRTAAIALGLVFFFGVSAYAGQRLLAAAIRRRRNTWENW